MISSATSLSTNRFRYHFGEQDSLFVIFYNHECWRMISDNGTKKQRKQNKTTTTRTMSFVNQYRKAVVTGNTRRERQFFCHRPLYRL